MTKKERIEGDSFANYVLSRYLIHIPVLGTVCTGSRPFILSHD